MDKHLRSVRHCGLALLCMALVLSGCKTASESTPTAPDLLPTDGASPEHTSTPPPIIHEDALPAGARIAFHSDRDGNFEIYVMLSDRSELTRLTDHPGRDLAPAWSPDGKRIAFMSDRDGDFEIFLLDIEGGALTQLTDDPADDVMPAWSPDGTKIAFSSSRDGDFEIYAIVTDGGMPTRLTMQEGDDRGASWSPDGERIAFHSDRDGDWEIYVMNADGTDLRRITSAAGVDGFPAWSPDGEQLAFTSNRGADFDIYVSATDGGAVSSFPLPGADDRAPAWFEDGSHIAFMSDVYGDWEILAVSIADGSFYRITDDGAEDGFPALTSYQEEAEGSQDVAASIEAFIQRYNLAFQQGDVDTLFNLLHPAVSQLYGAEACRSYLEYVIETPVQLELIEAAAVGSWTWEIDGRTTEIENAYLVEVNFSVQGQVSVKEIHLSDVGDGNVGWFTDCGEPLQ